jgi:hypothetical protein
MEMALHRRRQAGLNRPQTWAHKPYRGIDRSTPDWAGSSGLFAVKVAIEEGFERIVLAGVPMTAEGAHYYDAKVWTAAHVFHSGWNHRLPQIKDIVRSMSGWTRELLGEPTRDWLAAR